jgi:hypothetical protein
MMSGTRMVNENIYINKKVRMSKKSFKDWYFNRFEHPISLRDSVESNESETTEISCHSKNNYEDDTIDGFINRLVSNMLSKSNRE